MYSDLQKNRAKLSHNMLGTIMNFCGVGNPSGNTSNLTNARLSSTENNLLV